MNFLFDFPAIKDASNIPELVNKEKIYGKEYTFLCETQEARKKFKSTSTTDFVFQIIKSGESIFNYQKTLDDYLKTNVDTMYLLVKQNSRPPLFTYTTFLSTSQKEYTTSTESVEESLACEIVICRYIYAFLFNFDSGKNFQTIRERIDSTFPENSIVSENILKEINEALSKLKQGREPLRKLYNVMPEILKSLITKKGDILPEFKGDLLKAIKMTIEINGNSIYLESLRIAKDYQKILKVCKGSFDKLRVVSNILFNEGKSIKPDFLNFVDVASHYFRAYFCWAFIKINEIFVQKEDYSKKSFTVLTKDILNFAQEIFQIREVFFSCKVETDYFNFGKHLFDTLFCPVANYYSKVYRGIHHNIDKSLVKGVNEIFDETEGLDYFDQMS